LTVAKNRFGPAGSSVPLIFRATVGDFREEAREAGGRA
jgi:hypothetical protein